jgi:hypothetical protein
MHFHGDVELNCITSTEELTSINRNVPWNETHSDPLRLSVIFLLQLKISAPIKH